MNAVTPDRAPPGLWQRAFKRLLPDRFTTAAAICERHGMGESHLTGIPPDAVAFPETTAEVAEIVRLCRRFALPMIPFGTGTSAENHVAAPRGGVCIDMSRMAGVLAIHPEDRNVVVQPGLTRKALNYELRATGLFFPVDPGADASVGGMASTRASGTNAVRYGTMRNNVLALEVVLQDGEVIRTGSAAAKSSAGYDLTGLFVGSEGTLGVVTQLTLRLHPVPEAISVAVCSFQTIAAAVEAAISIMQAAIPVARMEFLDAVQMRACNARAGLGGAALPTLFFELHGTPAGVAEDAQRIGTLAGEHNASGFEWSGDRGEHARLWRARHTPTTPRWRCGRAASAGRPTSACHSRIWPNT